MLKLFAGTSIDQSMTPRTFADRFECPALPILPKQFLHKGKADTKDLGNFHLRPRATLIRLHNLSPQIQRIRSSHHCTITV